MKTKLTAERLRELLSYDPDTGAFFWQISSGGRRMDRPAGHINSAGYIAIKAEGTTYGAHRLAWLYVYGRWPCAVIDHINGEKADNRIVNLRDVDRCVNMQNQRKPQANNKAGYLGVTSDRSYKGARRFEASIYLNGKLKRIGRFYTAEEAHAAYVSAKRVYHEGCTI